MESDKRNTILNKACEIISSSGMENFSLSVLAESVGITKATLYNYFKSKDELLSSLISSGHKRFMKKGFKLNLTGNALDILLSAGSHWTDIFLSDENTSWLRIVFSTHLTSPLTEEEYHSIVLMLESQVQVVISSFSLTPVNGEIMTELLSSLLLKRLTESLEGDEIDLEEDLRKVALLVESLGKK